MGDMVGGSVNNKTKYFRLRRYDTVIPVIKKKRTSFENTLMKIS